MAKNILIFFPHQLQASFGGAYSYLYQLKKGFTAGDVKLHYLSDMMDWDEKEPAVAPRSSVMKDRIRRLVPSRLLYARRIRNYLKEINVEPFLQRLRKINFSAYDAIHFHEAVDIWRTAPQLKDYKGKIIFTSHSPKPYHLELLEDVFGLRKEDITRSAYRKLEEIDLVAFSNSDILVSPCDEALDAYRQQWPTFQELVSGKKMVFIPTGIEASVVTKASDEIRSLYHIDKDAFVICFNGRHNRVKGYDLVCGAAQILLEKYKNLVFLVTGKQDEPPVIQHRRWIETGWTTEPQNFLQASDLVVVPNRQTYFDLNVLSTLSLGKPVLLSKTGGNRYFEQFGAKGIFYLERPDINSLAAAIGEAMTKQEQLKDHQQELQTLFNQQFSLTVLASQYHQFYLSI